MPDLKIEVKTFTSKAPARLNVLKTEAIIAAAHDHSQQSKFKHLKYIAIWDTGATGTVITNKVATDLGLPIINFTDVGTAAGAFRMPVYMINIILPNGVGFQELRVTEGNLSGTDILIGMDIMGQGDFAVTNFEGKTAFSFRLPSLECIDFNISTPKKIITSTGLVADLNGIPARRQPCPCGSGKKYKNCCGR
ncbi:MAG: retroviral-like aspartic protease family protein [Candidatus Wallbacteria bacterium]|nr:retroviral-like aspartic protease family protein [Candidatus Wallbacteria bacterium]